MSSLFEKAIKRFFENLPVQIVNTGKEKIRRQTFYISEESNAKMNKLAFENGFLQQELSCLIIKTVYR